DGLCSRQCGFIMLRRVIPGCRHEGLVPSSASISHDGLWRGGRTGTDEVMSNLTQMRIEIVGIQVLQYLRYLLMKTLASSSIGHMLESGPNKRLCKLKVRPFAKEEVLMYPPLQTVQ